MKNKVKQQSLSQEKQTQLSPEKLAKLKKISKDIKKANRLNVQNPCSYHY